MRCYVSFVVREIPHMMTSMEFARFVSDVERAAVLATRDVRHTTGIPLEIVRTEQMIHVGLGVVWEFDHTHIANVREGHVRLVALMHETLTRYTRAVHGVDHVDILAIYQDDTPDTPET
ncbi:MULTISPECIES: hypothetical protein [Nocardiopsis]|uniref:Uncharacterized protein n=2 Tax=Nocardiopsis TaxID=2013 RepID=A0A840W8P8_9ACTN|nr:MULTISPECIES: hypothetical protein [Nocardiopsis]MBB5493430.1 hypothetical protein [Nocardiopsis metallicus]MCK9873045.1 hypothetical protein [Nocardiopsis dassonvillei]MEE2051642.1 hypothetical protein [Nocardiopsis umidischolae]